MLCPQTIQDRITAYGGVNRYGEPNFKLVWSRSERYRAGGVWPSDKYAGYRDVYVANSSPVRPRHGYWLLVEWVPPESFGGELVWRFAHRDELTGLGSLGPYPRRGRYRVAAKLHDVIVGNGEMTIIPWKLDSRITNLVIRTIQQCRRQSAKERMSILEREKAIADKNLDRAIDAVVNDSRRMQVMPSEIEDRIRILEKQWSKKRSRMGAGLHQGRQHA